ncbi:MAG TPA: polysaccharide biosynthesis/export family protein [Gemmatimonadales bacterium]|nr:polysaccharide biosynthesis/export family protein [Gemmatimonadales bacterium]
MQKASFFLGAALVLLAGRGAFAQGPADWDPDRVQATRDGLEHLKSKLLLAAQSPAYSNRLRSEAAAQAANIDRRLALGDFRPGDRIFISVAGEEQLKGDTFTVSPNRDVTLPIVGDMPLTGVLRSDLEPYTKKYISTYLRNPVVRSQALIPVSVFGKVVRPGFFTAPTGLPLTQVLTLYANGPAPDANLAGITISRDGKVIWGSQALVKAMSDGKTLDQLGIRAGDRIDVPGGATNAFSVVQTLSYALGIPLSLFAVIRLFSGK